MQYRLQDVARGRMGFTACLRQTVAQEGIAGLYRGFPTVIIGGAPATCVYLTTYEVRIQSLRRMHAARRNLPSSKCGKELK